MPKKRKPSRRNRGKKKPVRTAENETTPSRNGKEEDRIQRIKRLIQQGRYETPEKWDIAIERLFRELDKNNEDEDSESNRGDEIDDE